MTDFEEVEDPGEIDQLLGRSSALVQRSASGVFGLRRVLGWQAVPKESQLFFGAIDRELLAGACASIGLQELYAVALEPDPRRARSSVCKLPASPSGLARLNRECSGFNYLVCPSDLSFVVICSTDEFLVYAGSPQFLERTLGTSLPNALGAFREFAQAPHWRAEERNMLLTVANRPQDSGGASRWEAFDRDAGAIRPHRGLPPSPPRPRREAPRLRRGAGAVRGGA